LDDLRESSDWKESPFYLGWNSYSTPLSGENRKAWRGTKNRRNSSDEGQSTPNTVMLAPERTQDLFVFLENHEDEIRTLGDTHNKDVKKTLGRVYGFLINLGKERLQRSDGSN
jgi:hypothetical protein